MFPFPFKRKWKFVSLSVKREGYKSVKRKGNKGVKREGNKRVKKEGNKGVKKQGNEGVKRNHYDHFLMTLQVKYEQLIGKEFISNFNYLKHLCDY